MAAGDEEKKSVTQDELKAGVRLTAGHRVVLIVEGAVAETTTEMPGEPETTEPPATTTAEPAATTTVAATTTASPSTTTTAAPEETEETEETTTAAPAETPAEPPDTTSEAPSSTTTGAPGTTTTAAPSSTTTGGPSTTTTASGQASVTVDLPEEALELLPDGALTLSGDGIEDQQIAFSAAEHADGVLRFKFQWDGISVKTKLAATAGSGSVTLWEDQPAGDPAQFISWSGAVSELYPAPPAAGTDVAETIGSAIDDLEQLILEAIL